MTYVDMLEILLFFYDSAGAILYAFGGAYCKKVTTWFVQPNLLIVFACQVCTKLIKSGLDRLQGKKSSIYGLLQTTLLTAENLNPVWP